MKIIDDFVRSIKVEGLSSTTCTAYGYCIRVYMGYLASKEKALASVGHTDIEEYLGTLSEAGQSRSSIGWATLVLRRFHRWLFKSGRAAQDPASEFKVRRAPRRIPEALNKDEIERLRSLNHGSRLTGLRNRAIVELLYAAGLRISELTGLDLVDIDLSTGTVQVLGKGGKERIVPFGQAAREALVTYLEARQLKAPETDAVFLNAKGKRLDRGGAWWVLKNLAKRAGIEGMHPHRIRHAAATDLLEGGADIRTIQEYLGHSSITTTQGYTHVSPQFLRKACEAAHPGFSA